MAALSTNIITFVSILHGAVSSSISSMSMKGARIGIHMDVSKGTGTSYHYITSCTLIDSTLLGMTLTNPNGRFQIDSISIVGSSGISFQHGKLEVSNSEFSNGGSGVGLSTGAAIGATIVGNHFTQMSDAGIVVGGALLWGLVISSNTFVTCNSPFLVYGSGSWMISSNYCIDCTGPGTTMGSGPTVSTLNQGCT
eukprot:TRINITY_DN22309_c0_g1_i1.p1 TRINITY_DN22309_c0_g1~~TRINITY_DN22309_c0_g1_i1.p1  ORF type:complete len:225 (+),score=24.74 TRINITY_DN22309_c0_g1_i1:92-676(+)